MMCSGNAKLSDRNRLWKYSVGKAAHVKSWKSRGCWLMNSLLTREGDRLSSMLLACVRIKRNASSPVTSGVISMRESGIITAAEDEVDDSGEEFFPASLLALRSDFR